MDSCGILFHLFCYYCFVFIRGILTLFSLKSRSDPSTAVSVRMTMEAQHHDRSSIILNSAHARAGIQKLAAMPNMLQSAHSFIHSSPPPPPPPPLYPSYPPQPHPALHHYLSLYLPACLSRPLNPSHFHSYNALFCFHAGWMGGCTEGGMDGGMISLVHQQQEEEEKEEEEEAVASWRANLSLSPTHTHMLTSLCHSIICLPLSYSYIVPVRVL